MIYKIMLINRIFRLNKRNIKKYGSDAQFDFDSLNYLSVYLLYCFNTVLTPNSHETSSVFNFPN